MSYCRHNGVTSDLYIYHSIYGKWECCGCPLNQGESISISTIGELMTHLQMHKTASHKIPMHTFDRVQSEIDQYGVDWDGER